VRPGDFSHAIEGELVLVGDACAADRADPEGGCGCGRSFSGMNSHRATTTALVSDVDLSYEDLRLAVGGFFRDGGFSPEVLGDEDFADLVDQVVEETADFGRPWPVGTILERRLVWVSRRFLPEGDVRPWPLKHSL